MKKILLSLIAIVISCFAYAQQDSQAKPHITPHIRTERKELKREHYADRAQKIEMRIHREKHELRHMNNGKHHEWNRNHQTRPVKKGTPHQRRPLMDHRRK